MCPAFFTCTNVRLPYVRAHPASALSTQGWSVAALNWGKEGRHMNGNINGQTYYMRDIYVRIGRDIFTREMDL